MTTGPHNFLSHAAVLARLSARDRLRALTRTGGRDFTSNDYLALAESDCPLRPMYAGGALARRACRWERWRLAAVARAIIPSMKRWKKKPAGFLLGGETALYFPTGFAANAAIAATLPRRGDLILYDALIHASFRDGLEPGRIQAIEAPHNDIGAMEDIIKGWRAAGGTGQVWIAVETLYSMDGDRAPLADLVRLAARHDAMLVLDEAHATGVRGDQGRGL